MPPCHPGAAYDRHTASGGNPISEQTDKVHRMRVIKKSGEPSVAGLVRIAGRIGIPPAPGT